MPVRGYRRMATLAMPVYNEADGIGSTLVRVSRYLHDEVPGYDWEILVVDDGSKDDTLARAEQAIRENRLHARLLAHDVNCGLGSALTTLFRQSRGDVVVTIDADLTYDVTHIRPLLQAWEDSGSAVVVASPYSDEGMTVDVPTDLETRSRAANRYLTVMTDGEVRTHTGMVRAYDGEFVRNLPPLRSGPSANVEILYEAYRWGLTVTEIPATLDWSGREQRRGRSSLVDWKSIRESGQVLADGLRIRRVRRRVTPQLTTPRRPTPEIVIDLTEPSRRSGAPRFS